MSVKSVLIIIQLILLTTIGACIKDELTEPVQVSLQFSMNTEPEEGKYLKFDQGELIFGSLEFEGNREAGEDIFFVSTLENNLEADLDSRQSNQEVQYDIPQGIYNRIKLRIGNDGLDTGPVITYTGTYSSIHDGDIPVRIEFTGIEALQIDGINGTTGGDIVLNKEKPATAELYFDPFFLFQISNSRQLESATVSIVDGEPVIIISKDSNSVIFNIIINRLERSVSAIFN